MPSEKQKIEAWPLLKMALWRIVTDARLNVGYANAWDLTEKLYQAALTAAEKAEPVWGDREDDLTDAIRDNHPFRTKRFDIYERAQQLVSNRHSKAALIELVSYLLVRAEPAPDARSGAVKVDIDAILAPFWSIFTDNGQCVWPDVEVAIEEARNILAALEPAEPATDAWLSMDEAPKDGTMLRLLVRPSTGEGDSWTPFNDSSEPYQTIGFNALFHTLEDKWQFVGWDWCHDCFIDGAGELIGWLPFDTVSHKPATDAEPVAHIKRDENKVGVMPNEEMYRLPDGAPLYTRPPESQRSEARLREAEREHLLRDAEWLDAYGHQIWEEHDEEHTSGRLQNIAERIRAALAQGDVEAVASDLPTSSPESQKPTHRHKKRGGEYVLLGYGKMQAEDWKSPNPCGAYVHPIDMREVAIYRSVDDGSLWVRPREEFEDGRFEELT